MPRETIKASELTIFEFEKNPGNIQDVRTGSLTLIWELRERYLAHKLEAERMSKIYGAQLLFDLKGLSVGDMVLTNNAYHQIKELSVNPYDLRVRIALSNGHSYSLDGIPKLGEMEGEKPAAIKVQRS